MSLRTGFLSQVDWLPFLGELAAKATLVLLLTAVAAALLWRSSAAVRHLVWCVGVACVLALPVFSLVLPAWELPLLPARAAGATATPVLNGTPGSPASAFTAQPPVSAPVAAAERGAWLPGAAAMLAGAGVFVGVLWFVLGFWGVSRIGRRAERVRDPEWLATAHDAAEGLGLRRPVLLLRSRGAVMPATWGLLWPSIVLPSLADQWSDDRRRAVLAHELAHVKRFDCLTQALAQAACVLFWWHPAVWYAARRLRVERERACDDLVLRAGTRASDYAAHLLEIARAHRGLRMAAPAMVSMARPSHLESRLLWVLDGARARGVPSAAATAMTVLVGLLVVAPLAAMRPGERTAAGSVAAAEVPSAAAQNGAQDKGKGEKNKVPRGEVKRGGTAPAAALAAGSPAPAAARRDTIPRRPTAEELIAMRAVGVNAEYIGSLRAAGYTGLDPQELISMAATGVSGRYASEMNEAGLGRLSPQQLVSLRALGVTPRWLVDLRGQGVAPRSVEEASSLKAVGVDRAYVQGMHDAGYRDASTEQLVGMRAVGVTPSYVRELREQGLSGLSVDAIKGLRAVGVTGAYVQSLREAGLDGLDASTLSGLHAVGVTGTYVRELAEAGLTDLSLSEITGLRANGVTAAWVRELREAGYTGLTPGRLIQLRTSGLDPAHLRGRSGAPKKQH
jgi:beta-lactamase regulating signal transducer with metallopeptidase domain